MRAESSRPLPPPTAICVLVVDFADNTRLGFSVALRAAGFAVIATARGAEALSFAEARNPHGVLLARDLPDGDGLQIAAHLRSVGYHRPIVLVSDSADHATAVAALGIGITDFLTLPVKPSELRYAFIHALRRHERFAPEGESLDPADLSVGDLRGFAKYCLAQGRRRQAQAALSRLMRESHDLQALLLLGALHELDAEPAEADMLFRRAEALHAHQAFVATSDKLFHAFSHNPAGRADHLVG